MKRHMTIFLMALIALMMIPTIMAIDISVDSMQKYPNENISEMTLEYKIFSDELVTASFYIHDSEMIDTNNLTFQGQMYIYHKTNYIRYGPHNITFIVDQNNAITETDESNNNHIFSICVNGTEIPNNGVDEDCNGADDQSRDIKVTINSPAPQNRTTYTTWNIDVTTNDTADACVYEFGEREDYWLDPPIYNSITSNGTLNKISSTHFSKSNVDPLGDHNYLLITCNNTAGYKYSNSVHVEIDRAAPGTVSDLKVVWWPNTNYYVNLTYTMPGDNGFEKYPMIRYLNIRKSGQPITDANFDAARQLNTTETNCYSSQPGGNNVSCTVILEPSERSFYNTTTKEWQKPVTYFAIKTYDTVMNPSAKSNTAYNYSPAYDCGIEKTTLKRVAPNYYDSAYQTYYNYDQVILNITIINKGGDNTQCRYRQVNPSFGQNPIGSIDQTFNLSYNETLTFNYIWNISTATAQQYAADIEAAAPNELGGLGSYYGLDIHGINLSRYMEISDPYNLNLARYPNASSLPGLLYFDIYNWADTYNTGMTNFEIDRASFRWLPVKLNYTKLEPDWQMDPILNHPYFCLNTTTCPGSIGLPQDFYEYICQAPFTDCLKPYSQYLSTENFIGWNISQLEPGVSYQMWMTAGIYPQETENSQNITVLYG